MKQRPFTFSPRPKQRITLAEDDDMMTSSYNEMARFASLDTANEVSAVLEKWDRTILHFNRFATSLYEKTYSQRQEWQFLHLHGESDVPSPRMLG